MIPDSPRWDLLTRVSRSVIASVTTFARERGLRVEDVAVILTDDQHFAAHGLGQPLAPRAAASAAVMEKKAAQLAADEFWPDAWPGMFLAPTPPAFFRVLVYTGGIAEVLVVAPEAAVVPKGVGDA